MRQFAEVFQAGKVQPVVIYFDQKDSVAMGGSCLPGLDERSEEMNKWKTNKQTNKSPNL
jgi:hypothetical protein